MGNEYYAEDLKTDIDWFDGLGVFGEEAKNYIFYLLNKKPSKEVKALMIEEKI